MSVEICGIGMVFSAYWNGVKLIQLTVNLNKEQHFSEIRPGMLLLKGLAQ